MKRILRVLLVMTLMVSLCQAKGYCIDEWLKGQPDGEESPSDIDTLVQVNNEALDRLMSYGRFGAVISYATVSTVSVAAGSVVCSNATGSVRRTRSNSSVTTVTWANIDTGAEAASTTYYVYAVADTDVVTFTIKISTNSSAPTGVTYYQRLGSFYNNSSSNIDQSLIVNDGFPIIENTAITTAKIKDLAVTAAKIAAPLGTWTEGVSGAIYLAATDGFVVAYAEGTYKQTVVASTGSTSPPTTVTIKSQSNDSDNGTTWASVALPVKKGEYWSVTASSTGTLSYLIRWIPLGA